MKVTYELTREDFWNFNKFVTMSNPKYRFNYILSLAVPALAIAITLGFMGRVLILILVATILGGSLGAYLIYMISKRRVLKLPISKPGTLGEHTIEISVEGLAEKTEVNDSFYKWEGVRKIQTDKSYICFFIDTFMAYTIPKRAFSSSNDADNFYNTALGYWKRAAEIK